MAEKLIDLVRKGRTRELLAHEYLEWAVFSLGLTSLCTAIAATVLTNTGLFD